jgi:hypothetical protein
MAVSDGVRGRCLIGAGRGVSEPRLARIGVSNSSSSILRSRGPLPVSEAVIRSGLRCLIGRLRAGLMLTIVRRRCCNWNLEGHGVAVVVQCAKVLACCAVTLASASRVTTNNILLRVGGKVSMFRGRADDRDRRRRRQAEGEENAVTAAVLA